nr:hypothetical protein [Modestobacter excelsi]
MGAGPQHQVDEAVGHALLPGALVPGCLCGVGVLPQGVLHRAEDGQRQVGQAQRAQSVTGGVELDTALAQGGLDPAADGLTVESLHHPVRGGAQLGGGLVPEPGQHPRLRLGPVLVVEGSDHLAEGGGVLPGQLTGGQGVERGGQQVDQLQRLDHPRLRPRGGDGQGGGHLVDGPLADGGQDRGSGRAGGCGGGTDLGVGPVVRRRAGPAEVDDPASPPGLSGPDGPLLVAEHVQEQPAGLERSTPRREELVRPGDGRCATRRLVGRGGLVVPDQRPAGFAAHVLDAGAGRQQPSRRGMGEHPGHGRREGRIARPPGDRIDVEHVFENTGTVAR